MNYVSQQSVLQEAGLWQRITDETPTGDVDGSNTVFLVAHPPMADMDNDGEVTVLDVAVYVNGTSVRPSKIDDRLGEITLPTAPAVSAEVTVTYATSPVAPDDLTAIIEEAQDWVDDELSLVTSTPFTSSTLPARVRTIVRTMAAGMLQTWEYSLESNPEEVKSGERKIKRAEAWLTAYRSRIQTNTSDSLNVPRSNSAGHVFQSYNSTNNRWGPLPDEDVTVTRAE